MESSIIKSILTAAVVFMRLTGSASADLQASHRSQTSPLQQTVAEKSSIPSWFLRDVQIAEQVRFPISASNYSLNYGTVSAFNPQLNYLWFGANTGITEDKEFPFPIQGLYKSFSKNPSSSIAVGKVHPIYIFESIQQDKQLMGQLISAFSLYLSNGDYIGFSHDQLILNYGSGGMEHYAIYTVKGIAVPKTY